MIFTTVGAMEKHPARRSTYLILGLVGLAVAGFAVFWYGDTDRQLERRWEAMVNRVEAKSWRGVARLMAEDYEDPYGFDRETLISYARRTMVHFRRLEVRLESQSIERDGDTARITALVRLEGDGSPLARAIAAEVNRSFSPTEFVWRRQSWKPWDWQVVSFSNPEFDLSRYREPF
ncbi:MAG: hypothetical protein EA425_09495 [Puniceicoccaceae bacterium]|nr:MAG: hypothetical protein EA425_09495 [Puniceicoccaceae bacterium]